MSSRYKVLNAINDLKNAKIVNIYERHNMYYKILIWGINLLFVCILGDEMG